MTFEELISCWDNGKHNSNRFVYNQILAQARIHNLIPVIGAGLSVWVGYPQWKTLLLENAKEFGVETAVVDHQIGRAHV